MQHFYPIQAAPLSAVLVPAQHGVTPYQTTRETSIAWQVIRPTTTSPWWAVT